jgi:hypothetical protein
MRYIPKNSVGKIPKNAAKYPWAKKYNPMR